MVLGPVPMQGSVTAAPGIACRAEASAPTSGTPSLAWTPFRLPSPRLEPHSSGKSQGTAVGPYDVTLNCCGATQDRSPEPLKRGALNTSQSPVGHADAFVKLFFLKFCLKTGYLEALSTVFPYLGLFPTVQ